MVYFSSATKISLCCGPRVVSGGATQSSASEVGAAEMGCGKDDSVFARAVNPLEWYSSQGKNTLG